MRFYVKFFSEDEENGNKSHLISNIGSVGLDALDDLILYNQQYKSLGVENIFIDPSCAINSNSLKVRINEKVARASNLFKGKTTVDVEIPSESLSHFVEWNITESKELKEIKPAVKICGISIIPEKTELKVRAIRAKQVVKDGALINAWADAGFPIVWDLNKSLVNSFYWPGKSS